MDDNTLRRAFRIIPARAGFTKDKALRGAQNRDHPRSRGVYMTVSIIATPLPGSSPLARGLQTEEDDLSEEDGIIPARAGFTAYIGLATFWLEDHPRSRGVYHDPSLVLNSMVGSSPLARGLRCRRKT